MYREGTITTLKELIMLTGKLIGFNEAVIQQLQEDVKYKAYINAKQAQWTEDPIFMRLFEDKEAELFCKAIEDYYESHREPTRLDRAQR